MKVSEGIALGEDMGGLGGGVDILVEFKKFGRGEGKGGTRQGLTLSSLVGERMRMPSGSMVIWRRFQSW